MFYVVCSGTAFGQSTADGSDIRTDIVAFRNAVILKAKSSGSELTFKTHADDPYLITCLRDGEEAGFVSLHNGFNQVLSYPEDDPYEVVLQFANSILALDATETEIDKKNIVFVLRSKEFIDSVVSLTGETDQIISEHFISEHFVGELHKLYMVDSPSSLAMLNRDALKAFKDFDLNATALSNVRAQVSSLTVEPLTESISLYYVEDNEFLTSSVILLDEFWTKLDRSGEKEYLFTLPRKDQLFILEAKEPNALINARTIVEVTLEDNFNILSPQIFRRKNGNITLVE